MSNQTLGMKVADGSAGLRLSVSNEYLPPTGSSPSINILKR